MPNLAIEATRLSFDEFEYKLAKNRLAVNTVYAIKGRPGEDDELAVNVNGTGFTYHEGMADLESFHGKII